MKLFFDKKKKICITHHNDFRHLNKILKTKFENKSLCKFPLFYTPPKSYATAFAPNKTVICWLIFAIHPLITLFVRRLVWYEILTQKDGIIILYEPPCLSPFVNWHIEWSDYNGLWWAKQIRVQQLNCYLFAPITSTNDVWAMVAVQCCSSKCALTIELLLDMCESCFTASFKNLQGVPRKRNI